MRTAETMPSQAARSGAQRDAGFSLIELTMVVSIIAILIAITIPTVVGARARAQQRLPQTSLRNALTAAKVASTDVGNFSKATSAELPSFGPSFTYEPGDTAVPTPGKGPKDISVRIADVVAGDSQVWAAAAQSDDGACFWIKDVGAGAGAGTFYGTGAPCTGTAALAATGPNW